MAMANKDSAERNARLAAVAKSWYWANHEKALAKAKTWAASPQGKEVNKLWYAANKARLDLGRLERRNKWTAAGLCRKCGSTPIDGYKQCGRCRKLRRTDSVTNRHYNLKRYGLDQAEWLAIFNSQGNRCALCETRSPGRNGWHTDHDHDTGVVRGILCAGCNWGLGSFKDNPEVIARAIVYLRKHKPTLVG